MIKDPVRRKDLQAKRSRSHYESHRDEVKAASAAHIAKIRHRNHMLIRDRKNVPCVDCHRQFPYYVMQFDHVPGRGEKKFNLSDRLVYQMTVEDIEAEIAKCDVVCANCHATRTHERTIYHINGECGCTPTWFSLLHGSLV